MKVLIVEDELVAAQQLQRLLKEVEPDVEVLSVLQSIEESVEYFMEHKAPDLAFMDIHLADGSSFGIFDQVRVECPVVFTTAYDQYALQAFKVNSIDYLLKPINPADLCRAMEKYRKVSAPSLDGLEDLMKMMKQQYRQYQSYFLIPAGDRLLPLAVADIAYVWLDNKVARIVTSDNRSFSTDKPLDTLMEQLDPRLFFRVNRQYIVAHDAITDIGFWLLGKLKLNLSVEVPENVIVPKAKVPEFKAWFSR